MKRALILAVVVGAPAVAAAQVPAGQQPTAGDPNPFFVDKVEEEGDEDQTVWQGSLTSTSFLHSETADTTVVPSSMQPIENAAPLRWFTDLRAQVDARHIGGNAWDARFDGRARLVNSLPERGGGPDGVRVQSGSLSGNEFEIRDLYVVRGSEKTDVFIGRQTVLEIAGTKIDGLRIDTARSSRWTLLGFAGLYPARGSRSVTTDYPAAVQPAVDPNIDDAKGAPVLPVAAGAGAAYRTLKTYGAIGAGGIVPINEDQATGSLEKPRVFLTSNGYWRQSPQLDVYHYGVLDVLGADGVALTNLSLGVHYRPQQRLNVNAAVHHVDTETLNVQTQTLLEDPDTRPGVGTIQNNITVIRIASDSARLALSAALGQTLRWEVTVAGAARRRPDIVLDANDPAADQTIPGAQSGEVFFQVVDRDSLLDLRLAASFVRVFSLGDVGATRSDSTIARLAAGREIGGGRGEWEVDVDYLESLDENRATCDLTNIATCYGSAKVRAIGVSGTLFYRLGRDWMAVATAEVSQQQLTTLEGTMTVDNPPILALTGFFRLAYRF